jgi:FkbM family methyltransferase
MRKIKFIFSFFKISALLFLFILLKRKVLYLFKINEVDRVYTLPINFKNLIDKPLTFRTSDITTIFEIFHHQVYDIKGLNENSLIMDIGAHIGLFTLYVRAHYPFARIISVEPSPANLSILKKNIDNDLIEVAINNEDADVFFSQPLIGANHKIAKTGIQVKGMTFDNLYNHINSPHIDLMKIDIEGAEIYMLESKAFNNTNIDRVVIEAHNNRAQIENICTKKNIQTTIL